jgi:hypothetical protein
MVEIYSRVHMYMVVAGENEYSGTRNKIPHI